MKKICIVLALLIIFSAGTVWASGFRVPEQSARMMGVGNAWVATADDPSAIALNPAGITQLEGPAVSVGLIGASISLDYTAPDGSTESLEDKIHALPSLFAVGNLGTSNWSFGVGVSAPFGLGTEWPEDSFARYVNYQADLMLVNINPAVAYEFNENFSLAGGVDYYYSDVTLKRKYPWGPITFGLTGDQSALAIPDGNFKLKGNGGGWGWNGGLLFKFAERYSFGLAYRSKVKVDHEGDADLTNIGGAGLPAFGGTSFTTGGSAEIEYPDLLQFGIAARVTQQLLLEFDLEWAGWSSYKELTIKFDDENPFLMDTTYPKDWKDTWTFRLGAMYAVNPEWELMAGFIYDESPVPNETYDTLLPDTDERYGLTLGVSYKSGSVGLDLAYLALWGSERTVEGNTVGAPFADINGKYKSFTSLFGASFSWYF
jgi:long-chain fatty acid transport protein